MRTKTVSLSWLDGPPQAVPDRPRLPTFAVDLILELDKSFPHRCVSVGEDLVAAHRYAAKRELVDALLARMRSTAANPMDEITSVSN